MTISEQIKVLCVRQNLSLAELARRLGKSPQSFNDYSRAAEPPVRCGESHLSGLTEPPSLSIF